MKKLLLLLLLLLISINLFSQSRNETYFSKMFMLKEQNFTEFMNVQIGYGYEFTHSYTISLPDSSAWWNVRSTTGIDRTVIFKSKDKGQSWEKLFDGKCPVEYMFFINENVGYGFINKRDDYFAFSSNKRKDTVKLKYLSNYVLNGENKSYFENALVLIKTIDGGKTWNDASVINNINNINNKESILSQYISLYNRNKNFPSLNYLISPELFDFNMINGNIFVLGGDNNYDSSHPIGYMSSDNGLTWNISVLPESVKSIHGYLSNIKYSNGNYYMKIYRPYESDIPLISKDGINWNLK